MITLPSFYVAIAVAVVGGLALWANPRRRINQLFFSASLHAAIWLICVSTARLEESLLWLRISASVGAAMPFHLWLLKEAIVRGPHSLLRQKAIVWWALLVPFLAVLPLTEWFIPGSSTSADPSYSWGYPTFVGGVALMFLLLSRDTVVKARTVSGVAKLELQIIMLGGSAAGLIIMALMGLRPLVDNIPAYVQPLVILVLYSFTAIAITTHRIFDARHLLLLITQRGLLVAVVSALTLLVWQPLTSIVSVPVSLVVVVVLALWVAASLNQRLDRWLLRYPKAMQARLAAFNAAHSEVRTDELRQAFAKVLQGWGQTDRAFLLMEEDDQMEHDDVSLSKDSPAFRALCEIHWATPERLSRERDTQEREALKNFLRKHELGVVVYDDGPTMKMVVALGVRPSRSPFTFPEVIQLRELVSIFDSSLSRTQLLAKAQRAEQLATVGLLGASVAHEIRNPLVSIKAFAQLLPRHYDDPTFRERFSRLIGDEVARIDRLTEQLLDLAAPRSVDKANVMLNDLVRTCIDLVAARVASKNIQISTDLAAQPDIVFSDAHGLKQVILNLCFNAVQAQESRNNDKPIRLEVSTKRLDDGIELAVKDHGPGIPDAARLHLFEPFHSTKSNGFGLGLTVCGEILSELDSSITLDPYQEGEGALFRIHLPCPPRSS